MELFIQIYVSRIFTCLTRIVVKKMRLFITSYWARFKAKWYLNQFEITIRFYCHEFLENVRAKNLLSSIRIDSALLRS